MEELWVVDPLERPVRIWELTDAEHSETGASHLLDLTADEVQDRLRWPKG